MILDHIGTRFLGGDLYTSIYAIRYLSVWECDIEIRCDIDRQAEMRCLFILSYKYTLLLLVTVSVSLAYFYELLHVKSK